MSDFSSDERRREKGKTILVKSEISLDQYTEIETNDRELIQI
jgi:hypothetical protein